MNEIEKYLPTSEAILQVSEAGTIQAARDILTAAKIKRDEIQARMNEHPQLCDENWLKDMRTLLGIKLGLDWVIALPTEAANFLNAIREKESER